MIIFKIIFGRKYMHEKERLIQYCFIIIILTYKQIIRFLDI